MPAKGPTAMGTASPKPSREDRHRKLYLERLAAMKGEPLPDKPAWKQHGAFSQIERGGSNNYFWMALATRPADHWRDKEVAKVVELYQRGGFDWDEFVNPGEYWRWSAQSRIMLAPYYPDIADMVELDAALMALVMDGNRECWHAGQRSNPGAAKGSGITGLARWLLHGTMPAKPRKPKRLDRDDLSLRQRAELEGRWEIEQADHEWFGLVPWFVTSWPWDANPLWTAKKFIRLSSRWPCRSDVSFYRWDGGMIGSRFWSYGGGGNTAPLLGLVKYPREAEARVLWPWEKEGSVRGKAIRAGAIGPSLAEIGQDPWVQRIDLGDGNKAELEFPPHPMLEVRYGPAGARCWVRGEEVKP